MRTKENQLVLVEGANGLHTRLGISEERSTEIRKRVAEICKENAGKDAATVLAAVHNEFELDNECCYAQYMIGNDTGEPALRHMFALPEAVASSSL